MLTTMAAATARTAHRVALSLTGAGHLLPYHLAVCKLFLDASKVQKFPPIQAISGSSSGSIAAAVATQAPQRIPEFAQRFIKERGNGLTALEEFLSESDENCVESSPLLYICTTKCIDGSVHVFSASELNDKEEVLKCVRASCTIPRSFHPMDVLESSGSVAYPDSDGIEIRGEHYVDGGIAGPAPPVPDFHDGTIIVVSPISGSPREDAWRISPEDSSFTIWRELKCKGDFYVRPSVQNLRALRAGSGSTTSVEYQSWYDQGISDANKFLKEWEQQVDLTNK